MTMLALEVRDPSQVAETRRRIGDASAQAGFDEARVGQVALAVTELATNLLKHGGGGEVLAAVHDDRVELVSLDRGPGLGDIDACLTDGYSTAGTRGAGLGAVRRLARHFEVVSWPGRGTALLAEVARDARPRAKSAGRIGAVALPKPGQVVSGDGHAFHEDTGGLTLFVIDGLGHGTEAAIVAKEAISLFAAHGAETPAGILDAVHRGVRHTRGGAAAVARLSHASGTIAFAGIGNIAGCCVAADGGVRRMASLAGIVGHNARRVQTFEYPCASGLVVMHSDGLGTSWSLDKYPGLPRAHPLLVAAVLYRDFVRGTDDVTILVARTDPA